MGSQVETLRESGEAVTSTVAAFSAAAVDFIADQRIRFL
jgi:hypothetical protein